MTRGYIHINISDRYKEPDSRGLSLHRETRGGRRYNLPHFFSYHKMIVDDNDLCIKIQAAICSLRIACHRFLSQSKQAGIPSLLDKLCQSE